MAAYMYPISLALMSGFVMFLERLFPWRPEQKQFRPKLWSDLIHLVFNGHFLGLLLAGFFRAWEYHPIFHGQSLAAVKQSPQK